MGAEERKNSYIESGILAVSRSTMQSFVNFSISKDIPKARECINTYREYLSDAKTFFGDDCSLVRTLDNSIKGMEEELDAK